MLQRRGTLSEWQAVANTLVLQSGEVGVETTTGKFKIGDGQKTWSQLKYINPDNENELKYSKLAGGNTISGNQAITGNVTITGSASTSQNLTVNGQAVTKQINVSNNKIIGLADPENQTDAANKKYVDEVAQGLSIKPAVHAATTTNLSGTYTNGTAGVGAKLNLGPLIELSIDEENTWSRFDGVLVKNQTNAAHNGRYYVDQVGSATVDWILTRCGYCDTADEIPSAYVFVQGGATFASTGWVANVGDLEGFTVGTDDIDWIQFSGAGTYLAGDGLAIDGNEFSAVGIADRISVSASGIDIDSNYRGQTSIDTLGDIETGTWLADTVSIEHGGTGATNAEDALENFGLTATATEINTLDGISTSSSIEERLSDAESGLNLVNDDLGGKANLSGGNSFSDNQSVNGIITATNYDVVVTAVASDTINLNFTSGSGILTRTNPAGTITISGLNYKAGSTQTLFITNGLSPVSLSFLPNWIWVGSKPTSLAASKTGVLTVTSLGTSDTQAVASWVAQV